MANLPRTIILGLCCGLLGLAPDCALAQQITLEECLALARDNNPHLKAARTDIRTARETVTLADAANYPRIDLQGGYTAQLEPQAMEVQGRPMETQQPDYAFAGASLNYTLYDFGRRTARQQGARTAAEAVALGVAQQEQDILLQVIETYHRILEGMQMVEAAREELRTVEAHRRMAQALFDSGSVTRNDLLQADVRLAGSRQKLLGTDNRVANLKLRLAFLTGLPDVDSYELAEPVEQGAAVAAEKHDPAARPDLQALLRTIEVADQEARESRRAFYPELFTRLSLEYQQNDKVREQAIYAATVGLRVNLFDGFASTATERKAVAGRSRATQLHAAASEQARLEVRQAENDLKVAFEQITVTREAIRQGEENLRINRGRYEERVGTATDVLDAQTLLTQARSDYYRAVCDHRIAGARLRRALGTL